MTTPDSPLAETLAAARHALVGERAAIDHWEGHLSSSALSTATAIVALSLAAEKAVDGAPTDRALAARGIDWLLAHQNDDGGWGDTDRSFSNISTTALGWAALALAPSRDAGGRAGQRAAAWLADQAGGTEPTRLANAIGMRYGKDRTFSVPILTTCALAGRLGAGPDAWRVIPQLPFELAVIPRRFFTVLALPVVSYALPALIAMGLVRHRQRRSRNPAARLVRDMATARALSVLESLQPPNGGFLEAAPLTSFVAMSLVAAGYDRHAVTRRAIEFLRLSARPDGSWPIDTNLATWLTTLSIQALGGGGRLAAYLDARERRAITEWLLTQQTQVEHPYTGAAAGGWAWTNLPGGVPDSDDTSGALLALRALDSSGRATSETTRQAAARAVVWLLDLQNRDGGMPTFCRGWGALPFDRSGPDLTAHAIRAWLAWRPDLESVLQRCVDRAVGAALKYLAAAQRADGAFVPLWFGNQHARGEENPTYGTSRVLLALGAAKEGAPAAVKDLRIRGIQWLRSAQNPDGGWGGDAGTPSSIEETALAVTALADCRSDAPAFDAAERGAEWMTKATENGKTFSAAPIGLYFAKLWYYERLYPIVLASEAFERLSVEAKKT